MKTKKCIDPREEHKHFKWELCKNGQTRKLYQQNNFPKILLCKMTSERQCATTFYIESSSSVLPISLDILYMHIYDTQVYIQFGLDLTKLLHSKCLVVFCITFTPTCYIDNERQIL